MNQGIMNLGTFLNAVGNHLWQSTIFALFAWLLVQIFRWNSARVRYSIWMLASLKFLFPLSLLIALGSHLSGPAKQYVAAVNVPAIHFFELPFGSDPFQKATARSEPNPTPNQLPTRAVVAIWLVGVAAVVVSRLVRMRRVREILSMARRLEDGREIEAIERAKSRRGLARKVRCATTESVIEPGIHGIFRPTLVLPSGVAERLDAGQLDAIVDHEICHVRWYDNLSALIHMSVEAIFWFHPLVWWMGARLVDERERACDEQALENGGDPQVYASAILKICEFYVASPLDCVAGVSGGNLKRRIEEIMRHRMVQKLSGGKKLLLAALAVLAVAAPTTVGVLTALPSALNPRCPRPCHGLSSRWLRSSRVF
ncbi:MAG TPA: M56 family metallopeptidase [Bryobacteraceae bacterium]